MGNARPQQRGDLLLIALKSLNRSNGGVIRRNESGNRFKFTYPLAAALERINNDSTLSQDEKKQKALAETNNAYDLAKNDLHARKAIENVLNILNRPEPKAQIQQQQTPPQAPQVQMQTQIPQAPQVQVQKVSNHDPNAKPIKGIMNPKVNANKEAKKVTFGEDQPLAFDKNSPPEQVGIDKKNAEVVPQAPQQPQNIAPQAVSDVKPPAKPDVLPQVMMANYAQQLQLSSLDSNYASAQAIAGLWSSSKQIPNVELKGKDKSLVKGQLKNVKALEEHLQKTYASDFANIGWHGVSSLQRMLWQDSKFLELMSDPNFVKAMILNGQNKKEVTLGKIGTSEFTLSSLVLSSLGSNQVSYLGTVAPNWMNKPKIDGVQWDTLMEMALPISKPETPHQATPEFVEKLHAALAGAQTALLSLHGDKPIPSPSEISMHINSASSAVLVSNIEKMVADEKSAGILAAGVAGSSTQVARMNAQCLEVLSKYNDLLKANGGDHTKVLGLGLISHAMDAKHLIAAIHSLSVPMDKVPPNQVEGRKFLEDLLGKMKSGEAPPELESLMRIRLQQVAKHIIANKDKIGLTAEQLAAFQPPASKPAIPEASKPSTEAKTTPVSVTSAPVAVTSAPVAVTSAPVASSAPVTTASATDAATSATKPARDKPAAKEVKRNPAKDAAKLKADYVQILIKIDPKEFDRLAFSKANGGVTSPNVLNMLNKNNELSSEIINKIKSNQGNVKANNKDFDYYFALLEECKKRNNYDAASAIYNAIICSDYPKELKEYLKTHPKQQKLEATYSELFYPASNFKNVRKAENDAKGVVIPSLARITQGLTAINEGLDNDDPKAKLAASKSWDAQMNALIDMQTRAGKPIADYESKEKSFIATHMGIKGKHGFKVNECFAELNTTEASFGQSLNKVNSQELLKNYPKEVPEEVMTQAEATEFLAKFDAVKKSQQALAEILKTPDSKEWSKAIRDANKVYAEYAVAFNKVFSEQRKSFPPKISDKFTKDHNTQLGSIFIMPVQRGGRYELLGREFLTNMKEVDDNNKMKKEFKEFYKEMKLFQLEVNKSLHNGVYTHISDLSSDKLTASDTANALAELAAHGVTVPAPQAAAPQVAAPQVAAPQVAAPQVAAPQVAAPQAVAPQVAAPQVAAPKVVAPKVVAPKVAAPKVVAPKQDAPKAAVPKENPFKALLGKLAHQNTKAAIKINSKPSQEDINKFIDLKKQAQLVDSNLKTHESNFPDPTKITDPVSYGRAEGRWHESHLKIMDKYNDISNQIAKMQQAHPEIGELAKHQVRHVDYLNKFIENYNKMSTVTVGGAERQQRMRGELEEYKKSDNKAIRDLANEVSNKLSAPTIKVVQAAAPSATDQRPHAVVSAMQNHASHQPHLAQPDKTPPPVPPRTYKPKT